LQTLSLSNSKVSNIAPLSKLKSLKTLGLQRSRVVDISPLAPLKNLEKLWLQYTAITDLQPLSEMANMIVLNLFESKVSDIRPLKKLLKAGLQTKFPPHPNGDALTLTKCPLVDPPMEVALQGTEAILAYWGD
jgi:Leucine-rich repeat (LRR) protein